jgi:hypothetical protein
MKKSFGISVLKNLRSALNWLAGSPARAFVFIFILAFGVRAYSWIKIPPLLPNTDRELGAIAWSLAETGQFADAYIIPTGPTAHLPPVPPAILALVLSLFGRTWQAGYVFWGFTEMTNSVAYAMTPWVAGKLGVGKQAGFIGGIIGAFMEESYWSTHGEGLAAILLGLMLVAFMKRWSNERNSLFSSLMLGMGIGASFYVQPVLLLVFLGCFAFEIEWRRTNRKSVMSGMLAVGVVLACVPWTWRNYAVFHEFFFIRSNLGLELRMGNSPGAAATFEEMDRQGRIYKHPRATIEEARKIQQLGEMEYMHQSFVDALIWMKENPVEFLKLTFLRFIHFWFGPLNRSFTSILVAALTILAILGARRILPNLPLPQRILILTPLITYPLIYYLVAFMPSYRTPMDWILFLLAGIEIWGWIHFITHRITDGQSITADGSARTVELK